MKKCLFYSCSMVLVFLSGFTVAMNLEKLIGMNPNYEASWFKVGLAIFFGVLFAFKGALTLDDDKEKKGP